MEKNNIYMIIGLIEKEKSKVFEDIARTCIALENSKEEDKEELNEHLIIQVKYSKRLIESIIDLKDMLKKGE